ncbi:MAG: response regulator [Lachnospiraceae bacterium]|nr:response regulator [Lachnospiraceae bacterium]
MIEGLFIVATVAGAVFFILGLKVKHINVGFLLTTFLLIVANLLSIAILKCDTIKGARNLFLCYYIVNAWLFFGATWTVGCMDTLKRYDYSLVPMGLVCILQTALVIYCFNQPRTMEFTKEIFMGRLWWASNPMEGAEGLIGPKTYSILCYISCLMVIGRLFWGFFGAHDLLKRKYVAIGIFQWVVLLLDWAYFTNYWPTWTITVAMNPICYAAYYYVFIQSDLKLKSSTLLRFANEMTDGVIIYNYHNDFIHANKPITQLPPNMLEDLKDMREVDKWFDFKEVIDGKEYLYLKLPTETRYYEAKKTTIGSRRAFLGTVYSFRDMTATVEQIRNMEKVNYELERTARMKSDFLANMSHELRTPMNAVIGMTEIALREAISEKVKDCLNQISRSGNNLLNIINDILDYSKIEAGKMEIVPDSYEPLSEVNDISNILQTRIKDKDIELFFIVDPNLPKEFYGDSMRIRQILINLANNAIKFTEQGYVMIKLVVEPAGEDEVILDFHVMDTGRGIKKEDLDKLFVSFQQLDSKRNRNIEGTGLGLTISKKLCEAMNGTIGVSSEYGKGSDFWFRIPQKVINPTKLLNIEGHGDIVAFIINERGFMGDIFNSEMDSLGIERHLLDNLKQYRPTGKKEFLFIEESMFTSEFEEFMDENPGLVAVVLTKVNSTFGTERKNVRILPRPMNTLNMVLMLRDQSISSFWGKHEKHGRIKFTAPDAKILIVDDNSINLTIAVGLIEPLKIQCKTAESGSEAIRMVEKEHFDLILMDHMMPVMDGVETTRAIRANILSAADTPILALTANVAEGSMEMFIKAGMADLIAKPIDVKQLNAKLREWLPEDKIVDEVSDSADKDAGAEMDNGEEAYDCLDCKKAIEGLGSAALFKKIVSDYYRKGPAIYSAIEEAINRGDWSDYTIRMHALKSTSRQIGAIDLGDMAEKLEKAGKIADMEAVAVYHSVTMETFRKLLDDLSKYFNEEKEEETLPEITEEELKAVFEDLVAACDELDMDRMEACEKRLKESTFPEEKREMIENLCSAIEQMDTDACERIMNEYMLEN